MSQSGAISLITLPDLPIARIFEFCDLRARAQLSATCSKMRSVLQKWHNVVFERENAACRVLQRVWLQQLCGSALPLLESNFPLALLQDPYRLQSAVPANSGSLQKKVTAQELNRFHYRAQHYKITLRQNEAMTCDGHFVYRITLRKVACFFRECFFALSQCTQPDTKISEIALFVGTVRVRRWRFNPGCRSIRIIPNCVLQSLPERQAFLQIKIDQPSLVVAGKLLLRTKTFYVPNNSVWNELIESLIHKQTRGATECHSIHF